MNDDITPINPALAIYLGTRLVKKKAQVDLYFYLTHLPYIKCMYL